MASASTRIRRAMSNLRLLAAGLAALAAMAAPRPPSVLADRVFLGGRIWTGDPARPRAQALALAGDVIVAVGTDAEVRPYIGPATTTVSLRGRFVAPGFNDAHLHFLVVETSDLADAALPGYERVAAEGGLKVRFYFALPMLKDIPLDELARYKELRTRYPGPLIKFGAVKGFVDGVVESKTAAMLEPYVGGGTGELNWTPADLDRTVALYDREGFQIFLHAIGDKAIRIALDAYERAARTDGTSGRRHRVDHIEVPTRADIARFAPLGVIASTLALFANPDQNTFDVYAPTLGPDRASRAMAFRSLDEAGALHAFGSDSPVFSMEVLRGIYCSATPMTPEGTPAGRRQPPRAILAQGPPRPFNLAPT